VNDRKARWQELTKSECFELLARQRLGRVAFVDDRGPIVFPVNFVLDRHTVVLRTGEGTKLDAAIVGSRVAFEVDGADAAACTGWSVLVRGERRGHRPGGVGAPAQAAAGPWAPGAKAHYVRILPAALTGRRILPPGPSDQGGGPRPEVMARPRRWGCGRGNRHRHGRI
jgi:hypothetical protein